MPVLLLVVAGVVLLLATSFTTLGWVLVAIGLGLFVLWLLVLGGMIASLSAIEKSFNRRF